MGWPQSTPVALGQMSGTFVGLPVLHTQVLVQGIAALADAIAKIAEMSNTDRIKVSVTTVGG